MTDNRITMRERVLLLDTGETGTVVGRGHDPEILYVYVHLDGQSPATKHAVLLSRLEPLEESRRWGDEIVALTSARQEVAVSDLGPLLAACAQLSAGGYLCVRRSGRKGWKVNVRRAGRDWTNSGASLEAALASALKRLHFMGTERIESCAAEGALTSSEKASELRPARGSLNGQAPGTCGDAR